MKIYTTTEMFHILKPEEIAISIDSGREVSVNESGTFGWEDIDCFLVLNKSILSEKWIIRSK
ncbi:hypothetical protein [Priestia megaterium]|uniref:hypothetical protein n=1 Tax=Priestia megaterium TaxID=1404 RepID=UPI00211B971A|nr:hypothetical protein [Priestia megaterium]